MRVPHSIYLRLILFLMAGAMFVLSVHVALFVTHPASDVREFKEILIPEGASFRAVASELEREGIVTDRFTFIGANPNILSAASLS